MRLSQTFDEVFGVCGIHPLYAGFNIDFYSYSLVEYTPQSREEILNAMNDDNMVAYGEIGLDYHDFGPDYNYAGPELQKEIFISQMRDALDIGKPIVIHTREAEEDTLSLMKQYIPRDWKLHVHCYTDTLEFAQTLISEFDNLYIGFSGVITFKNARKLRNVVNELPIERILAETGFKVVDFLRLDGPFMTPVPCRGTPAHPGHIPYIIESIAKTKVSVSYPNSLEGNRT